MSQTYVIVMPSCTTFRVYHVDFGTLDTQYVYHTMRLCTLASNEPGAEALVHNVQRHHGFAVGIPRNAAALSQAP